MLGEYVTHRRCLQKNTLFAIAEVLSLKRKLRDGKGGRTLESGALSVSDSNHMGQ